MSNSNMKSALSPPFRADLHCHTTCSDGSLSPVEVVRLAYEKGLSGLSITDHDSIEAYQTAVPFAQELGITLLSGTELSTIHRNCSVHILAYGFALDSPIIQGFCADYNQRRLDRNRAILDLLTKHKMPLTEDEAYSMTTSGLTRQRQTLGRPHIALAMVKKGYVKTIKEAFERFIGEGRPCYVRGNYLCAEEALNLIHQANAYAIIAHPQLISKGAIARDLLEMNFDGLEGYYGRLPLDQEEKWVRTGLRKGWLVTGGSDFHGEIKPIIPLGCSWVGKETFDILYKRFEENSKPK